MKKRLTQAQLDDLQATSFTSTAHSRIKAKSVMEHNPQSVSHSDWYAWCAQEEFGADFRQKELQSKIMPSDNLVKEIAKFPDDYPYSVQHAVVLECLPWLSIMIMLARSRLIHLSSVMCHLSGLTQPALLFQPMQSPPQMTSLLQDWLLRNPASFGLTSLVTSKLSKLPRIGATSRRLRISMFQSFSMDGSNMPPELLRPFDHSLVELQDKILDGDASCVAFMNYVYRTLQMMVCESDMFKPCSSINWCGIPNIKVGLAQAFLPSSIWHGRRTSRMCSVAWMLQGGKTCFEDARAWPWDDAHPNPRRRFSTSSSQARLSGWLTSLHHGIGSWRGLQGWSNHLAHSSNPFKLPSGNTINYAQLWSYATNIYKRSFERLAVTSEWAPSQALRRAQWSPSLRQVLLQWTCLHTTRLPKSMKSCKPPTLVQTVSHRLSPKATESSLQRAWSAVPNENPRRMMAQPALKTQMHCQHFNSSLCLRSWKASLLKRRCKKQHCNRGCLVTATNLQPLRKGMQMPYEMRNTREMSWAMLIGSSSGEARMRTSSEPSIAKPCSGTTILVNFVASTSHDAHWKKDKPSFLFLRFFARKGVRRNEEERHACCIASAQLHL